MPMISLDKILFATDFSEAARAAFEYATLFARRFAARVHAVHVLPLVEGDQAAAEAQFPNALPDGLDDIVASRRIIRALKPELGILELAREIDADLIILGTHGRSGAKHVLLGSVAERVVQHADSPVLTVRRSDRP